MKRWLSLLLLLMPMLTPAQTVITPVAGVATIDVSTCPSTGTCAFKILLTANTTIALNNARGTVNILLQENAAGGWTVTWPSTVSSPPTVTTTANTTTLVSLQFDSSTGLWYVTSGSSTGGGLPTPFPTSPPGAPQIAGETPASCGTAGTAQWYVTGGTPDNVIAGVTDTLRGSDRGGRDRYTNAGAVALTLPQVAATVTNTARSAGLLTVTAANNLATGQCVSMTGSTNGGGALNFSGVAVNSAVAGSFTVLLPGADVGSAADTGTATRDDFSASYSVLLKNDAGGNVTMTPQSPATVNGGANLVVTPNFLCKVGVPDFTNNPNKWIADCWQANNVAAGGTAGVVLVPPNTAANTIAPTANSTVGLTVVGTAGTGTPHIQDWNLFGGGAASAAFIDSAGNFQAQASLFSANDVVAGASSNFRCSGNCSYVAFNQTGTISFGMTSSGNTFTGINKMGTGNYTGTAGGAAGATLVQSGDATGATGANIINPLIIRPGLATSATGIPSGRNMGEGYLVGGGTTTLWNLQCMTATAFTVNDCPTTSTLVEGVATGTAGPLFVIRDGWAPINATAAVTVGHTVCTATTTAGKITDSGGLGSCAVGANVGRVVAVSGTTQVSNAAGTGVQSVTLSTTLPLISLRID